MTWNYGLSYAEFAFIVTFLILYAIFFLRTFRAARQLGTTAWAVIPKAFLRASYFGMLLVALLGPAFGEAERELIAEGKDIFLLVDLSKSMDATDVAPSRLEKLKFELNRLVNDLAGNRFGLLVVSTDAYVHAPLTSDQSALATFIRSLNTRLMPESGTNLCAALTLALQKHLQNRTADNNTKVIVLLTDGEDFGTCDRSLLNRIRTYGIAMFIVGVGTETGSTIPAGNHIVRDGDGRAVRSRLNRNLLRQLSQNTGGSYLELNAASSDLSALTSAIQGLENRLIDQRKIRVTSNKYYYFLLIALILISVDLLVSVRTFKL